MRGFRRRSGTSTARHPLRVAEVLRRGGVVLACGVTPEDECLQVCCPCGRTQLLARARIEPARRAEDISAYHCDCGAVLVVTGHPTPVPTPGRHIFGDLAVEPLTQGGITIVIRPAS